MVVACYTIHYIQMVKTNLSHIHATTDCKLIVILTWFILKNISRRFIYSKIYSKMLYSIHRFRNRVRMK